MQRPQPVMEVSDAPLARPRLRPAPLPRSFPVKIPGTAFARGMKAKDELMRRIHASLDIVEQRAVAEGHDGAAAGTAADQPTVIDLLRASRDEEGRGLTRHVQPRLASLPTPQLVPCHSQCDGCLAFALPAPCPAGTRLPTRC